MKINKGPQGTHCSDVGNTQPLVALDWMRVVSLARFTTTVSINLVVICCLGFTKNIINGNTHEPIENHLLWPNLILIQGTVPLDHILLIYPRWRRLHEQDKGRTLSGMRTGQQTSASRLPFRRTRRGCRISILLSHPDKDSTRWSSRPCYKVTSDRDLSLLQGLGDKAQIMVHCDLINIDSTEYPNK